MPDADVTVTADFISASEPAPRTFTVTFDAKGGSSVSSQSVREGKTAAKPDAPTRKGYAFLGWFTDAACTRAWSFSTAVTRSMTLYAKWEKAARTFTVSFDARGGAPTLTDQTVEEGRLAVKPDSPAREEYTFGGWFTRADGGKPWQFNVYTVDEDTVLYAVWTAESAGSPVTPGAPVGLPGGGTVARDPDTGEVTVTPPAGGDGPTITITPPAGGGDVTVDPGTGEITVPGGSTVTIPDGQGGRTTVTLPDEENEAALTPAGDGKLSIPTGSSVTTGGGVTITVEEGGPATVAPDGTVALPGGGKVTVTRPDGGRETLDLPAGGRVDPDNYQTRPGGNDDDDDDGGYVPSVGKPSVSAPGKGGSVTADSKGNVTITPDKGYEIDRVTVNGKEVPVPKDGKLTGLKRTDRVVVTFREIPQAPAPAVDRFADVKSTDWFYEGVKAVAEKGLMEGTDGTHFSPYMNTSRAMIATILWRLSDSPEAGAEPRYPDCLPGSWYARAVAWCSGQGVVKGYGSGDFGPEDPITREQLAVMLWRYAQSRGWDVSVGEDTNILSYTDADRAGEWAIPALQWAVGSGVMKGKDGGRLDPTGQATRAEAAVMLRRYLESKK